MQQNRTKNTRQADPSYSYWRKGLEIIQGMHYSTAAVLNKLIASALHHLKLMLTMHTHQDLTTDLSKERDNIPSILSSRSRDLFLHCIIHPR